MPKELYATIYKGTIITSGLLFFTGMGTTGTTSISSFQAGYCFFILSIMLISIPILSKQNESTLNIILNLLPFAIMISVALSLMYFSIKYYEIIKEGRVSSGFSIFNNITIILLLIQLFTLYSVISAPNFEEKGVPLVTLNAILLMAILSGISANIIRTILKFFTTDGFSTPNILKI
jgi:uncharacterized membrane protein